METGKVGSTGAAADQAAPCPQGAHPGSSVPPAKLIVVVEVVSGQGSGKSVDGVGCCLPSMQETLDLIHNSAHNLSKKERLGIIVER